ncbi:MAG: hypothetical protein ACOY0T_14090 [Myxococcota bacterium]
MSIATPPGYASAEQQTTSRLGVPIAMATFAAATLLTCFYETCLSTPRAYSALGSDSSSALLALAAVATGFGVRWRRWSSFDSATGFAALACFTAGSAHALVDAFARADWLPWLGRLVAVSGGGLSGAVAAALVKDFGRDLAELEALSYLANPFRLGLLALLWLAVLLAFPPLGILRRAALLAAFSAAVAVLLPFLARLLAKPLPRSLVGRGLGLLAPFAALTSLLAADVVMPLPAVQRHAGEVVFVLNSARGEHVVSRSQGGMLLFSNDVLATTSTDASRFAEALVHPAFALAASRERVLLLDDGNGSVLREALRWQDLRKLQLLPHDPELFQRARRSNWFRALAGASFEDPRLVWSGREATRYLDAGQETFDVVLMNASDPSSYHSGKYFSLHWFQRVRAHLKPGGVFAVQTTSPLRTPETYAGILETLRRAGFELVTYRAALPTMGEWGFALAFGEERPLSTRLARAASVPNGARYVTRATLPALLQAAPELPPPGAGVINHLYDQPLVELYRREDQAFNE